MLLITIFFFILAGVQCQPEMIPVEDPNDITIAFGSCLNTFEDDDKIERALRSIIQTQSDLWIWAGDAVYLDGDTFLLGTLPGAGYDVSDEDYTRSIFNTLKEHPTYVELKESVPIIGVWDDHDYAHDNMDKTFRYKERNMGIFLDFLDEPQDSTRRNQQGLYRSYYIGENREIKVILIDIRYNADSRSTLDGIFNVNNPLTFSDQLGDEQWDWLDGELQDQTPLYTLIVSGLQCLPDDRPVIDNWFVDSRERLFDMINTHQKSGVILMSGDVHYAEMLRHPCPARVGYRSLHEFTSSGLTHSAWYADIVDGLVSNTYSREEDRYFGRNIGVIRLARQENSTEPPNLVFEARDLDGNVVLTREVLYSDVLYDEALANSYTGCDFSSDSSDSAGKAIFGENERSSEEESSFFEEKNWLLEEESEVFIEEF